MDALCPVCQLAMVQVSGHFHCANCHGSYQQQADCPDCGKPLQVLKACGAVDYFCQQGHGLISKSRVHFSYLPTV
ncbi:zinc ribbon domain-containing protein [Yersinia hibernica]|uniref:Primosomal protein N' (Replication factor Y)-superfamily II helicase n=2 Tax=Yersinia TaxID=629 RepID=A0ABX5R2S3_9GAMM|nr:zinc ribbon domain-containing protein [Yersinia hibernica]AHM75335.1 primosomal protein N' (replication factor Y) - superfamily II helicase [Yersinia hibernica]OVZ90384.1 primosomal protein N' (replication factor Y) - superfamily II helicase [Yersinia kristensenii]QAX79932.1 primosomal protein N' (replication factor Y) - superfamily II helicase [Yersinia hibernica]